TPMSSAARPSKPTSVCSTRSQNFMTPFPPTARTSARRADLGADQLHMLRQHALAVRRDRIRLRVDDLDAVLLEDAARLALRRRHVGPIGADIFRPQVGHRLLQFG